MKLQGTWKVRQLELQRLQLMSSDELTALNKLNSSDKTLALAELVLRIRHGQLTAI